MSGGLEVDWFSKLDRFCLLVAFEGTQMEDDVTSGPLASASGLLPGVFM